eukprot:TRINITY_DN781_c0_g2_i6.p1 TRINITY_DN781_c0_g2~~TRINITY_DN781_c0_g2_i6.p1  ORF type:complete len:251 (+),score=32.48 TRINITY_DN781_c0_g2_i6:81-833(+)
MCIRDSPKTPCKYCAGVAVGLVEKFIRRILMLLLKSNNNMDIKDCELLSESQKKCDLSFKVVLIGSASVGKSCILLRATNNQFNESYNVTMGTDMHSLQMRIQGKILELQIWDTAGMEQFRSMVKVFFRGAKAVFLVYDITRKETFHAAEMWLRMVQDNAPSDVRVVLIGNKKDEDNNRMVAVKEGKNFAEMMRVSDFRETSAKTGEGIPEILKWLGKQLYMDHENIDFKVPPLKGTKLDRKENKKDGCC